MKLWAILKLQSLYCGVLFFQVLQDAMTVTKVVEEPNTRVSLWLVGEGQPSGKSV